MKVVGYVRVRTGAQVDGWGLDRQEAAIRAACKAQGHRLVHIYRDEGVSGSRDLADRPGLSAAVNRLTRRQGRRDADGLIVAHLDRFARTLTVQESALAILWHADAMVFTPEGEVHADDPDDPARTLVRQVMGAVIQYERAQAVKRMRDGMRAKAAAGRKATGRYAYGYEGQGTGRERDAAPRADEQRAIRRMKTLRRAGKSYREIAATLDAEGFPTPRNGSTGTWAAMTVQRILTRELGDRAKAGA